MWSPKGDPGRCRARVRILGRSFCMTTEEWSEAREEGPCLEIPSDHILRSSGAGGGSVRLGLDGLRGLSEPQPSHC